MMVIELVPFQKGFDIDVIIAERVNTQPVNGDVLSKFVAADQTGAVSLTIWGLDGTTVRPGDVLRITGAETKLYQNQIVLSKSKTGKAKRIGEHTFPFVERPDISREWTWAQDSKQRWEATKVNPSTSSASEPFPKGPANKSNATSTIPTHRNGIPGSIPPTHRIPIHATHSETQTRKRPLPPGWENEQGRVNKGGDPGTVQRNSNFGNQFVPAGSGGVRVGTRPQKKSRGMVS